MPAATLDSPTVRHALAQLDTALDLRNVKMKLADTEEGPGLTDEQITVMESEYRKFLALHLMHPNLDIVPCKIVDKMWHSHILDTAAYRIDCDAIFGQFLDHFPYFGMRGAEDEKALQNAYADTLDCYRDAFGEPPADTWVTVDASSRCKRTACKPQKCR